MLVVGQPFPSGFQVVMSALRAQESFFLEFLAALLDRRLLSSADRDG